MREAEIHMAPTKKSRPQMVGEGHGKPLKTSAVEQNGAPAVDEDSTSSADSGDAWLSRKIEDGVESESESESESIPTTSEDSSSSSDEDENDSGEDRDGSGPESGQPPSDLKTRLAAFLPQMAKANQTLSESERVDDVDEDEERYIEMELGLGVLAEKQEAGDIRTKVPESAFSPEDDPSGELPPSLERMQERPQKKRKIEEVS